jgi:hypothetical protein
MKAVGHSFSATATTWFRLVLVLGSLMAGFGCKPKIGEDCASSVDCSISADRICDVTQPGGYCTVFNCEPNGCPAEAACVAFTEGTCSTAAVSTRFRRTFCMRTCEDDSDCRGGSYRCLDISRDQSRRIVDRDQGKRICAVPPAIPRPQTPDAPFPDPAVCFPSDASFDVARPEAGSSPRDAQSEAEPTESSLADRANDPGDATDTEAGSEAGTEDAPDSSPAETGADVSSDAVEDVADEAETTLSPP